MIVRLFFGFNAAVIVLEEHEYTPRQKKKMVPHHQNSKIQIDVVVRQVIWLAIQIKEPYTINGTITIP